FCFPSRRLLRRRRLRFLDEHSRQPLQLLAQLPQLSLRHGVLGPQPSQLLLALLPLLLDRRPVAFPLGDLMGPLPASGDLPQPPQPAVLPVLPVPLGHQLSPLRLHLSGLHVQPADLAPAQPIQAALGAGGIRRRLDRLLAVALQCQRLACQRSFLLRQRLAKLLTLQPQPAVLATGIVATVAGSLHLGHFLLPPPVAPLMHILQLPLPALQGLLAFLDAGQRLLAPRLPARLFLGQPRPLAFQRPAHQGQLLFAVLPV